MQTVAAPGAATLSVEGLEVRAGRKRVLVRAFSWQHRAGGITWLVGENGTGKSSLLRVIVGCDRAAAGRVQWLRSPRRLRYYAPTVRAPDDLTVGEWSDFVVATQSGVPSVEAVEQLRPSAVRSRTFNTLSTGEAKRFLLWGLLRPLEGPLVADEPYEHLSREAKVVLTGALRRLASTEVVLVATNQDVPLLDGDQILKLDGTEVQVGQ